MTASRLLPGLQLPGLLLPALLLLVLPGTTALGQAAPKATTADFAWLTGSWEGHLTGRDGILDITFTAPKAGTISGVMRLIDKNQVLVVELLSIVDAPGGTEMRFRHFSPSLEAYEREFRQTMRLTDHSSDRDVFENTVPYDKALMSTQPRITQFLRRGRDEFVGRSDIIDDNGKPAVMESVYLRK